jgi:N-acetylglucosamine transport system substrate-binding protein
MLPCGSWLELESKDSIPADFELTVAPTPSLSGDQIPFEGILAAAGEGFIVPSQGKNVQGGKEWLRLLFSKEGGRAFAELTQNIPVVKGAVDDVVFTGGTASMQTVLAAAGENTFQSRYGGWYKLLNDEAKLVMADLLQKKISVEEFQETVQGIADDVKSDDSIPKYTR